MDYILVIFSLIWQYPELRFVFCLVSVLFIAGIFISFWSAFIPAKSLYKVYPGEHAKRISFEQLKHEYKKDPNAWLLFENEIYYIPDRKALNEEGKHLYRKAYTRFEDGGKYAEAIGVRVVLNNRFEGRKYMHFLGSRASSPKLVSAR